MSEKNVNLVRFNIQNAKYAIGNVIADFKGLNLEFIKVGAPDEW